MEPDPLNDGLAQRILDRIDGLPHQVLPRPDPLCLAAGLFDMAEHTGIAITELAAIS
jgi:hypothetical protein